MLNFEQYLNAKGIPSHIQAEIISGIKSLPVPATKQQVQAAGARVNSRYPNEPISPFDLFINAYRKWETLQGRNAVL